MKLGDDVTLEGYTFIAGSYTPASPADKDLSKDPPDIAFYRHDKTGKIYYILSKDFQAEAPKPYTGKLTAMMLKTLVPKLTYKEAVGLVE